MIIELLKDWRHEGGKIYKKGTELNVHPLDGNILIKKKLAVELPKKIEENGRNN
jgi:hypothetical protein